MNALHRTLFLCLLLKPLTCSKQYDPCEKVGKRFCDFDCCYDYLTCRKDDPEMVYLGADSIMRYQKEGKVDGFSFAYRVSNVLFRTISQYWKPTDYTYKQWTDEKPNRVIENLNEAYETECFMNDPRIGNLVAAVVHHNETILVCGKQINIFNMLTDYGQYNKLIKPILRNSDDCRKNYPLLCTNEKGQPELIDAFTLEDENRNEFMVAYYGESQIDNPGLYDREYTIARTRDGKYEYLGKVSGQLSAIDIYEIDRTTNVTKGLIALNDGRVCPFEHKIGDTNFDFERHGFIEDGCRAMQTYLACPQAWCVDAVLDSYFTVSKMQNKEEVYFILYNNMWRVDAKPLPMDVPIHAKHRVWLEDYTTDLSKVVLKIRKESSAAFTFDDGNGDEIVISSKPSANGNPHWEAVSVKEHPNAIVHSISGLIGNIMKPDAAWFDKSLNKLYLFEGDKYYTFQNEEDIYNGSAWVQTGDGSTSELGLMDLDGIADDGIDAVVSMNGSNYFFNQLFRFYQIDDGQTKAKEKSKLVQKDFFRLLSQCYYNDVESYLEILYRYNETVVLEQMLVSIQSEYTTATLEASEASYAPYIIAIVFLGGVVAIVGLVLLFVTRKQRVVFQTTVVKRYEVQPRSRSASIRLRRKSALKPLKSRSVSNSQKSKSVLNPVKSKSDVKSVISKSPE